MEEIIVKIDVSEKYIDTINEHMDKIIRNVTQEFPFEYKFSNTLEIPNESIKFKPKTITHTFYKSMKRLIIEDNSIVITYQGYAYKSFDRTILDDVELVDYLLTKLEIPKATYLEIQYIRRDKLIDEEYEERFSEIYDIDANKEILTFTKQEDYTKDDYKLRILYGKFNYPKLSRSNYVIDCSCKLDKTSPQENLVKNLKNMDNMVINHLKNIEQEN